MENDLFEVLSKLHDGIKNNSLDQLYPELKKGLNINESLKEYQQEYYENNKAYIKNWKKKWYQKNNNKYALCECGSIVKILGLKAHKKTSKHQQFEIINEKPPKIEGYIECECGSIVQNLHNHLKTRKHKSWGMVKKLT